MSRYFVFRVDADSNIGIGHLMRCLTLSKKMSDYGFSSAFICNKTTDIYKDLIVNSGSLYFSIPSSLEDTNKNLEEYDAGVTLGICEDINVFMLVVDSYSLGIKWEVDVRKIINRVMVIDDLANKQHDCLCLLDSTYNRTSSDYKNKVNSDASLFMGSRFCILREEFHILRDKAVHKRSNTTEIKSILINFGGVDPMMYTLLSFRLIRELNSSIKIKIIISKACTSLEDILRISSSDKNVDVYIDTKNVADIMLNSDLSVGALGTTSWERCCLGLPSIALLSADNQLQNASLLHDKKAVILSNLNNLKGDLIRLISNEDGMNIWQEMVKSCFSICDGTGIYRISRELLKSTFSLDDFVIEDSQDLFEWQLEDTARVFSRNTKKPEKKEHDEWVRDSLYNINRRIWVLKVNGINAGYLRLDDIGDTEEVSILISEKFRNIGLASFAIKEAKSKSKYHVVLAYVNPNNTDSIHLFTRSGFKEMEDNNYIWEI